LGNGLREVGVEWWVFGVLCREGVGKWAVLATHPPMSRVPIMYAQSVTSMLGDCQCCEIEDWPGRDVGLVLLVSLLVGWVVRRRSRVDADGPCERGLPVGNEPGC